MFVCSQVKQNIYKANFLRKKHWFDNWRYSFTGYNVKTGKEDFFFIDIFIINPGISPNSVVLAQRTDNRKNRLKPSYVLVKAGCIGKWSKQIHNFYPSSELLTRPNTFELQVGSCKLTENAFYGSVFVDSSDAAFPECLSDSGQMSWKLEINKKFGCSVKKCGINRHSPQWSPFGVNTEFSGEVSLDGETYKVVPETSRGYMDRLNGKTFQDQRLYICGANLTSQFTSKKLSNACFLVRQVAKKRFSKDAPHSFIICFFSENIKYEFDGRKNSKTCPVKCRIIRDAGTISWNFSAENRKYVIDINIQCKVSDMLGLRFETSDAGLCENLMRTGALKGEIKLYLKVGKSLEALEHALVDTVFGDFTL